MKKLSSTPIIDRFMLGVPSTKEQIDSAKKEIRELLLINWDRLMKEKEAPDERVYDELSIQRKALLQHWKSLCQIMEHYYPEETQRPSVFDHFNYRISRYDPTK